MRTRLLVSLAVVVGLGTTSCSGPPPTPAQVQGGETTALNLLNAGCSVADTTGDQYVEFGCALAIIADNTAIQVTNLFVGVPVAGAADFAAKHPETATSKPLVAAYKAIHPTASTAFKAGVGTKS